MAASRAGMARASRLVRHAARRVIRRNRSTVAVAVVAALMASGTTLAVSNLVLGTSNSASATTTLKSGVNSAVLSIQNTNATGGTSARGLAITVPAGRPPLTVNFGSGKATNLNADKLDGKEASSFGDVRQFYGSANGSDLGTTMISFRGLDVVRVAVVEDSTLECGIQLRGTVSGELAGVSAPGNPWSATTPSTIQAETVWAGIHGFGTFTFLDYATHQVVSGTFTVYALPQNAGCYWYGTLVAPV